MPTTNCIFEEPWWLDAVTDGNWSCVELKAGDNIVLRMPYVIKKKYGLRVMSMPPLTQTLGPWIRPSQAKLSKRLARQKDLIDELVQNLPPVDFIRVNLHWSVDNWLPFHWHGFQQTTRYTYVIDDLSDPEAIWMDMDERIRREVRKATNRFKLSVRQDGDVEQFLDLNEQIFRRQGMPLPYSRELVRRIDRACVERDARRIFFAVDPDGRTHAAVFIVFDERCAYYLMGGTDQMHRNTGAMSLLLWEAIKFSSGVTKRFDFEGSMIESIERFFRAFGAKPVPYFQITKRSRRMRFLHGAYEMARAFTSKG